MKFTCDSYELSQACQIIERAASNKTPMPSVEGIFIEAMNNKLKLVGFDLEMGIDTSIVADVESDGAIVINAHTLTETLRKLPGKTVNISSDMRNVATISSNDFKSTLIGISADDYPELPVVAGGFCITIQSSVLKDMIRKTIFSVAIKDSKIVHNGVKFEIEENHIRLVAVDGVRLAIRNEAIDYNGEPISFVVPAKALNEVLKLLTDDDKEININVGKKHIIFCVDGYNIISRLLEGDFLNYKSALPTNFKTQVKVNTSDFADSIDRSSLIITDKLKSPIKCAFEDNSIKISVVATMGTANDMVEADIQGDNIIIGFNNKYMSDALRVCDCEDVMLMMNGALAPIIIKPCEGEEFVFLILPVRLKNEE